MNLQSTTKPKRAYRKHKHLVDFKKLKDELNYREETKIIAKEEKDQKWIDEKLVEKYTAKGEYDWQPLYFIKTHGVTISTARKIYMQLQALKKKRFKI
jgi:hypothetical protein